MNNKIKQKINKIHNNFLLFCLKKKLGKTTYGAKFIFLIMKILGKITFYVNTKQTNARGHYVPQFILKKFRITDDKSKLGFVNFYNKQTFSFGEEVVRDSAQIKDFYIFTDKKNNLSDFTEKILFGRLETSFSFIVNNILKKNGSYKFTFLESSIVATFISFQITRTPKFLINLEKYICFLIENHQLNFKNDLFINDKTANWNAINKIIINNHHSVSEKDLKLYKQKISLTGNKMVVTFLQLISGKIASHMAEKIHFKNINILSTVENNLDKLIISDNPVVFYKDLYGFLTFPVWWEIENTDTYLIFPLSPQKALFLKSGKRKDGTNYEKDKIGFILVEMNNGGQFYNALSFVFSNNKEYLKNLKNYFKTLL